MSRVSSKKLETKFSTEESWIELKLNWTNLLLQFSFCKTLFRVQYIFKHLKVSHLTFRQYIWKSISWSIFVENSSTCAFWYECVCNGWCYSPGALRQLQGPNTYILHPFSFSRKSHVPNRGRRMETWMFWLVQSKWWRHWEFAELPVEKGNNKVIIVLLIFDLFDIKTMLHFAPLMTQNNYIGVCYIVC